MPGEYYTWLKERLTEKRYLHSLAVEERAAFLARTHGEDERSAALAGLLHDCCHSLKKDEQLKIIENRGILLDKLTLAQPQLWHAVAGSIVIEGELGIRDEGILIAVRQHTTGSASMSKLAETVFLADLTSDDREYSDVPYYRALSERDPERCMLEILAFELGSRVLSRAPIVRDAWEAYNHYWSKINERNNI